MLQLQARQLFLECTFIVYLKLENVSIHGIFNSKVKRFVIILKHRLLLISEQFKHDISTNQPLSMRPT